MVVVAPVAKPEVSQRADDSVTSRSAKWVKRLFDITAFLTLLVIAFSLRWNATRGDLWLDEADYALASVRGFEANRRDLPEPTSADRIIRLRHYHPPLIAHVVGLASRFGKDDRTLRLPSVIAGALTVGLVYLCGIFLYSPRRGDPEDWTPRMIALASALVLLAAPAHIRASSHILPWAFITLWLVAISVGLTAYAQNRHPAWLVGLGVAMGLLFVTSEYFVVACLAVGLGLPLLLWSATREPSRRLPTALAVVVGTLAAGGIAYALWPAGLSGGFFTMLGHYVGMADDPWPVNIAGQTYARAPKWAYLYWYKTMFPGYAAWYLAGVLGVVLLGIMRELASGRVAFILLTGSILAAAHRSHIIGPEYLAHALPFLSLLGGLLFAAVAAYVGEVTSVIALACAAGALVAPVRGTLSGMEIQSQHPRWPDAGTYLKSRWKPGTRMLVPAYGGVGRWYVIYGAGAPVEEWRIQSLPVSVARPTLLREIARGAYKYVAVGSTFSDWAYTDNRIRLMLQTWKVVWKSREPDNGPSRLRIYQLPAGVDARHPLEIPEN